MRYDLFNPDKFKSLFLFRNGGFHLFLFPDLLLYLLHGGGIILASTHQSTFTYLAQHPGLHSPWISTKLHLGTPKVLMVIIYSEFSRDKRARPDT